MCNLFDVERNTYVTHLNPGFVQHRPNIISEEHHTSMLRVIFRVMWVLWINAANKKETVKNASVLGLNLFGIFIGFLEYYMMESR